MKMALFALLLSLQCAAHAERRIVTLAPSAAEWVMEFGVNAEEVVGVSEFTDFPESLKGKPTIGPYNKVNLEKILTLKPTLVVATRDGNIKEQVEKMKNLGIKVALLDGQSLKTIRDSIDVLGQSLEMAGRAKELQAQWDQSVSLKLSQSMSESRPLIFVELGRTPWITVGKNSFIREAIELAGGNNFGSILSGSYPKVQFERILKSNPDWVLVPMMNYTPERKAETLQYWAKYKTLNAVKNKQVCVITWNEIMRPVARLLHGVDLLSQLIKTKKAEGAYCEP